jgi:mono/diheme cytochrome c family protein
MIKTKNYLRKKQQQHKIFQMIVMKHIFPALTLASAVIISSCSSVQRDPGKIYMPDMAYSRAIETYSDPTSLKEAGINYNGAPVAGTVKREGIAAFPVAIDKAGDTTNYVASKQVSNPLPALNEKDMAESKRLYNVNCAICHGEKLDGNGPIYNGGNGPYPIAPKNLVADPVVSKMPAGQMMYSVTYGKNLMGSYAAQLSTKQRWMVIHYVQSMQPGGAPKAAATDSTAVAKKN